MCSHLFLTRHLSALQTVSLEFEIMATLFLIPNRVLSTVMLGLIWKSNENNVQAQSATSSLVNCVQEMTFYKLNTTKLPYAGNIFSMINRPT